MAASRGRFGPNAVFQEALLDRPAPVSSTLGDKAGAYDLIRRAFLEIAAECGVTGQFVAADSGPMGGSRSEELIAVRPSATSDVAVECSGCGYAASMETGRFGRPLEGDSGPLALDEIEAHDGLSIEALAASSSSRPACRS